MQRKRSSKTRLSTRTLAAFPRDNLFDALGPETLVVSVHACGGLTDRVLDLAIAGRCPVAVLPCCHAIRRSDTGGLTGWVEDALAVDLSRAARLRAAGYEVFTQTIPEDITPQNRLLMGRPRQGPPPSSRPSQNGESRDPPHA